MKKLSGMILLIVAFAGLGFAQDKMAPAKSPSAADGVKQLEKDWLAAEKAGDADKLGQIIADDWAGLGPDGKTVDKKEYVEGYKSGKNKIASYEIGAMTVKVMGNIAVVQGSDTEKSSYEGKDSSGKYVWMDVFAKNDDKWQVVRSQYALVK
jgi:ketosteroid isomerase-like protein